MHGAGSRRGVVNTSFGICLTVSVWLADVYPLLDTVITGDPTAVSR